MKRLAVAGAMGLTLGITTLFVWWRFDGDIKRASARVAHNSLLAATRCGPIEYQEAGAGVPLLAVHGSGGGYDQGMAFAGALADHGIRVIAMSRFGYLRTPMPADASAAAQADAHVCLLDALGIHQAAVSGVSAGAPSALQMAIRHPERVSALVLLVPLAYKPPTLADSAPPLPPWAENTMMHLIGSDFLFWAALHVAPDAARLSGEHGATVYALLAGLEPPDQPTVVGRSQDGCWVLCWARSRIGGDVCAVESRLERRVDIVCVLAASRPRVRVRVHGWR